MARTAQTTRTEGHPAQELFQKYGEISRISKERFNRYKGTEWYFQPLTVDGKRMVVGYVGSYPDTPEWSSFSGEAIAAPYEGFCRMWDEHTSTDIYGVVAAMKEGGAITMSMERYRAVLDSGESLPTCKHCHQLIL